MSHTLTDLRKNLFDALQGIKDGTIELDKARAINEVSKTIIDTAKVEVDYIRTLGGEGHSTFIPTADQPTRIPAQSEPGNGIVSITRHVLEG